MVQFFDDGGVPLPDGGVVEGGDVDSLFFAFFLEVFQDIGPEVGVGVVPAGAVLYYVCGACGSNFGYHGGFGGEGDYDGGFVAEGADGGDACEAGVAAGGGVEVEGCVGEGECVGGGGLSDVFEDEVSNATGFEGAGWLEEFELEEDAAIG